MSNYRYLRVLKEELATECARADPKQESEKAALKAERAQLETEKTQLRVAQLQLEDVKWKLELAHSKLDVAKAQLETAQRQLEAANAEIVIDGKKLSVARTSLDAAKVRFTVATKQMNAAKSRLASAKTFTDIIAAKESDTAVNKDDSRAELKVRIFELEEDNSKRKEKIVQLEDKKLSIEIELCEKKMEIRNLFKKVKELEKQLDRSRKEKQTMQIDLLAEVIDLKKQLDGRSDEKKAVQNKTEKITPKIPTLMRKYGKINPKVYFDLTSRGVPVGRIVIELDSENSPLQLIDNFCTLCTGENGCHSKGVPLYFKGTTIMRMQGGYYLVGGGDTVGKNDFDEFDSIYSSYIQHNVLRSVYKLGDLIVPVLPNPDGRCFFSMPIVDIYLAARTMQNHVKIGRLV